MYLVFVSLKLLKHEGCTASTGVLQTAKETQGILFIDHLWFDAVWIIAAVVEMPH